jgi:uncharacterized damage-inducible protein DinB
MANELTMALWSKVAEQIERSDHLLSLIPLDKLSWRPSLLDGFGTAPDGFGAATDRGPGEVENNCAAAAAALFSIGELLGHMMDCMAGFCAALYKIDPLRLEHLSGLRALPVNHFCEVEEARERMNEYSARIKEGFALLTDDVLTRVLPTVFVPTGEPALTVLLGNLEHVINHKFQLFMYLRLLGLPVSTRDLYRFREINSI